MQGMEQALSLPEIRHLITRYLSHSDLKSCMVLSRAWADSVGPRLWSSIVVGPKWSPSLLTALRRHRSSIRVLHIYQNDFPIEVFGLFDNLQSLQTSNLRYSGSVQDQMVDLVQRNRSSLHTVIEGYSVGVWDKSLRTMLDCPLLKSLALAKVVFTDHELLEAFHKTCSRITRLRLVLVENWFQPKFPAQVFTNLRIIHVYPLKNKLQLEFLKGCPNLRQLTFFVDESITIEDFIQVVIPACLKLEVLQYDGSRPEDWTQWKHLIHALPPMKSIQFGPTAYRGRCLRTPFALSSHFATLQAIWLDSFWVCGSMDIQSVLCSCPNLRYVSAKQFHIREDQSGSPWVCHQLEYFGINIQQQPEDQPAQYCAYDQLARLSRLRILDIGTPEGRRVPRLGDGSFFSLNKGLERLAPLKELWYLDLESHRLNWQMEDIEWMIQAWPSLHAIFSRPHEDFTECQRLRERLKAASIGFRKTHALYLDHIKVSMN